MSEEHFQEGDGLCFYRCVLCGSVVSPWDIKEHKGCKKCGGTKIKPTNVSLIEKIVQIFLHPLVWKWEGESDDITLPANEEG